MAQRTAQPTARPKLTRERAIDLFMVMLEDDTEEAPWMVMGDLQFWSASSFAHSLRIYARERGRPWYVASMMPILYRWPTASRKKVLAPDVFVAFVEDHSRESFDTTKGNDFPPFVLEVVSPASRTRDRQDKRQAYDVLGVREYALFTPQRNGPALLGGYRRDARGRFVSWPTDADGRLWSDVLELFLVVRGALLQAQTADGEWLLTPEQTAAARREADDARCAAEAEVAHLRAELERARRPDAPAT
ncbi:MAG: Uma2 family endonuclease [Chloroflexi bacterium]|nr:Uma2 family endonuclease [Chloroflexota bacterium]